MEKIVPSLLGFAAGFISAIILFGHSEGQTGLIPNFRVSLFGYYFSPHHWATYIVLIFILAVIQAKTQFLPKNIFYFLIAFFLGTINQGLTYSDWYIWMTKL